MRNKRLNQEMEAAFALLPSSCGSDNTHLCGEPACRQCCRAFDR